MLLASLWALPAALLHSATHLVAQATQLLLLLSFLASLAFHVGWVNRFMVWTMERELSKILNGTPVTVGSLKVDLLRGKGWASNLVLHAPRRQQWKWRSPVQARVGNLYVECNLVACLLSLWFLWEERPLDVFTVEVSDVQGFVERKHNVFNFYLMDPHIDVPDPTDEDEDELHDGELDAELVDDGDDGADHDAGDGWDEHNGEEGTALRRESNPPTPPATERRWERSSSQSATPGLEHGDCDGPQASDTAQRLVDDMVRTLGRAAQRGSFHSALVESRARIKSELQALQARKSKTEAMQEGVKIVQQVSKSLVEKSQAVPSLVVPNRRRGGPKEKIVYGRVGRVVLRDLRVFTRDHGFDSDRRRSTAASAPTDHDASLMSAARGGGWNKPIYLEKVVLRAAELCPPLSAKDADNPHLPAVYQPLDRCFEIIWKRVLTEIAKSNTGAFFQTAMGEVLDYYMEPPAQPQPQSSAAVGAAASSAPATATAPVPRGD